MNWFWWALASAVFAGATAVLAKAGVDKVDSNLATAIRTTVALFFCWGLAWATYSPGSFANLGTRTWVFLSLSGLATGLSWICYFHALKVGDVSQVAPVDKLSVAIAIVLAMVFFGEKVSLKEGVGIGLMVTGVLVIAWK
ncbi:MAG: EamA family transporter [Prosthecobacter sp.]